MDIRVFEIMLKSCKVAMAIHLRADWWNWNFLNGSLPERKVTQQKPQISSQLDDMLGYSSGDTGLAWKGLNYKFVPVYLAYLAQWLGDDNQKMPAIRFVSD